MYARMGIGLATAAAAVAIVAATAAPADARTSFSVSIGTPFFFGGPTFYPTYRYAYAPYYVAPAPTVTYGFSAHVAWCQQHYRSYNPATDLFLGYDGKYHYCAAPY